MVTTILLFDNFRKIRQKAIASNQKRKSSIASRRVHHQTSSNMFVNLYHLYLSSREVYYIFLEQYFQPQKS